MKYWFKKCFGSVLEVNDLSLWQHMGGVDAWISRPSREILISLGSREQHFLAFWIRDKSISQQMMVGNRVLYLY